MKFNNDPDIAKIQLALHKNLKSIVGSKGRELQNFIKNSLNFLKDRNPEKPPLFESLVGREGGLALEVIFSWDFFKLLVQHIGAVIHLGAMLFVPNLLGLRKEDVERAMNDSEFIESLANDEQIKPFRKEFHDNIDLIDGVIRQLRDIPDNDPNALIDKAFIGSIIQVLTQNKEKVNLQTTTEILGLVLKGKIIRDEAAKLKNTLALAKAGLRLIKEFEGLGQPIELKKSQISKLIANAISKNAPGLINEKAFEKALEKVASAEGMAVVLDKADKIIDAINPDSPNYALAAAYAVELIGGELYEGVQSVVNDPNLILSQCFSVKSQNENGEVIYELSALGKNLVSKGLIKAPDQVVDNVDTWSVTVMGTPEMFRKDSFLSKNFPQFFSGKMQLKKVDVLKDDFEAQVMVGFDASALVDLSQSVFARKETLQQAGHVVRDFANDMPILGSVSKVLKLVKESPELSDKISHHKELITGLAKQFTPADALRKFGLQSSFLDIIRTVLKDQKTIASLEKIIIQLGSENDPLMIDEVLKLLSENPEIGEFLKEPEIQKQIVSLVVELNNSVEIIKKYLGRNEFIPLRDELEPSLKDLSDTALKLAFDNGLLEEVSLNLRCGQLVNGFMLGERVLNIQDRTKAETAAKELHLVLAASKGEIPTELSSEQLAKLEPLGIKSLEQLKAELVEGQVNMAGFELYNQVSFVFKPDFPKDQIESKQPIIQKLATEKEIAFKILSAGGDVEEGISAAEAIGEIAPERALLLKQVLKTHTDKLTDIPEGTAKLCERFKHEMQMRSLKTTLIGCDSEAVFSFASGVTGNVDMTKDQLNELIKAKSFLPEEVTEILMDGKESISANEIILKLRGIACRQKIDEEVDEIQVILGSVLASFSSILQLPYSVAGEKLRSLQDQLGDSESFTRDEIKRFLNEKLGNPSDLEIITSQLIIGDSITRDMLLVNLERVAKEQEQAENDKASVIPALNKLLNRIPQNSKMLQAVKRVIVEKGSPDSQSDIIIEALGELFASDTYSKEEKELLANKVVKPILRQMQMPAAAINAVEKVIDKVLDSKESAEGLYRNGEIKDILKKILNKNDTKKLWRNTFGLLRIISKLGVSNAVGIGKQFARANVQKDPFVVERFKTQVDIARKDLVEGQKVEIQSIFRRYFRKGGLYTLSGQDLSAVNLSQAIISNAVFEQTNFGSVNLTNAEFISCDFNECTIPQDLQLVGSKFDLKSFESLIKNAEDKKLDINKLFASGVTVISAGVPQEMDARLVYGLMQYCKAKKIPFSQNVLVNAVKKERTHEEFYVFLRGGFKTMQKAFVGNVRAMDLYEEGKFSGLNIEQAQDLVRFLRVAQRVSQSDMDNFISILKSPAYDNIKEIAISLNADDETRIQIYKDLQNSENIDAIKASLNGFNPSSDLQHLKDESVTVILKQWYLNRASGKMIPEDSRNTDSGTISLIEKAANLKEDTLVDDITKAIASKLLEDRFLEYADRMHDLERIHSAVKMLVDELSPEYKGKLGSSDIARLADDAYELIYPHTKYEKTSFAKLYIEDIRTVDEISSWLRPRFTKESIAVNDIIQRVPSLEQYRSKLDAMPLVTLELISANPEGFAARSAIDVNQGMLRNDTDERIHDQMYALDTESLGKLLSAADEIFDKIKDYSKKSDIPLSEMVKNIEVLNNLKLLSDELVARYNLCGNAQSEKLCLNLVAKVYNDSDQVKTLIATPIGRTMLANVFFIELENLSKEKPPVDLTKLEECSERLCSKVDVRHTIVLAALSKTQGIKIAESIFKQLGIAECWRDANKTKASIENLANILGSKIFESGETIDEKKLSSIIGEKKPEVGAKFWTADQSTGLVKAYQDIYYSKISGWYEVGKFDQKDNHTMRLLQSFDSHLEGQGRVI